jgi:hypothetical protein
LRKKRVMEWMMEMEKSRMMGAVVEMKRVEEENKEEEDEEEERNNIMEFILQFESVLDEDDKAYIERLWKKEQKHVMNMKQISIDR